MKAPTQELIEKMKQNRAVFDLLTLEEHACLRFAGSENCIMFSTAHDFPWIPFEAPIKPYGTYRIKPDYTLRDSMDLVVHNVTIGKNHGLYAIVAPGTDYDGLYIDTAASIPGFLGIEYAEIEDRIFSSRPLVWMVNDELQWRYQEIHIEKINKAVHLTPFKVYFRKAVNPKGE